ncbi:circumsporozoite protein-like [Triticum dicoccoides]|uniref:circumsporozoite protein-like n=1 Tax=Triticum dicoccoides TaxID=85692 RepID=UPI001890A758|nr:circumsporozoite protein-like [Triticum dicoccoides]
MGFKIKFKNLLQRGASAAGSSGYGGGGGGADDGATPTTPPRVPLAPPPASPTSPPPLQAPRPPPRPAGKDTDEGPDDENSQEVADDEVSSVMEPDEVSHRVAWMESPADQWPGLSKECKTLGLSPCWSIFYIGFCTLQPVSICPAKILKLNLMRERKTLGNLKV